MHPPGIDTETVPRAAPPWWADIDLCHLGNDLSQPALCGDTSVVEKMCGDWDGEAVCRTCGNPMCPRCVQLADLEDQLEVEDWE